MKEIRWHGRGGQGAVTAAELFAVAAFKDGKYSQAFGAFGPERRGAPVMSFTRIDDSFVRLRQQVYAPDIVVVIEPNLLNVIDVTAGLKGGGTIILNSDKPVGLGDGFKVHRVDRLLIACYFEPTYKS